MKSKAKNTDSPELMMKKQTLIAWTKILYKKGMIDLGKCNSMIAEFEKLKA